MQTIKPEKIITTISNLKTGEEYKTEEEWKAKGVPEADIRRDVKVIMPSLDLIGKTKQNNIMPLKKLKRAAGKVLGGAKKVVRKVVPKEVAGIMTAAAPFVAPYSLPAAAALSIGGQLKQTGRINPILTGASLLPGIRFAGGAGLGAFKPTGFARFGQDFGPSTQVGLRGLLFGQGPGQTGQLGQFGETAEKFLFGSPVGGEYDKATQGIFGKGGEYGFTKGSLIRKADGTLNKTNIAAMAASGFSLATATKQIEEEAIEEGASDSEIAALTAEAADFWSTLSSEDFKVTPTLAQGGRVGFALGTRPTAQESGLGGLPIEADMRYSGGFMPYGAREKADDVPARLSKNEFVFTADAVRAAGGGSVQKGAQKMYNTMKQLEAMGRA